LTLFEELAEILADLEGVDLADHGFSFLSEPI